MFKDERPDGCIKIFFNKLGVFVFINVVSNPRFSESQVKLLICCNVTTQKRHKRMHIHTHTHTHKGCTIHTGLKLEK